MINKLLKTLKNEGLLITIKKIFKKIIYKILVLKNRIKYRLLKQKKNIITKSVNLDDFDTFIVFENNFCWNKIMKQRPQQVASNFEGNILFFYHSDEKKDFCNKSHFKILKNNLILIDLGIYRDILFESLKNKTNKYLMVYSTDYIPLERINLYRERCFSLIYDYVDDIDEKLSGNELSKKLKKRHKNIVNDSNNIIITTAEKLYKNVLNLNLDANVKLVSNGVDYEHFKYKSYELPEDMKIAKQNYKYLIGYYGALASWFDYELINKIALNKDYCIVLLGVDYDNTLEQSGVLKNENILYLGKKDYDDLPKYGCNFDVCIIPFLINEITLSTNPVKIFEYMAMERPIVTTDLPECRKYNCVSIAKNHEEFIKLIDEKIKEKKNKTDLIKCAMENTWKQKCNDIINFANENNVYNLNKILFRKNFDRIIIWRSPFGWNVPLYQRPQHIAKKFSEQGCLVFYEVTSQTDNICNLKKEYDNLYLIDFSSNVFSNYFFKCLDEIIDIPKYIQIYSTNWSMSLEEEKNYIKNGYKILYEYIDDISPQLAGTNEIPKFIIDKYNFALSTINDVFIVVTADLLKKDVLNKRGSKNMVFSCNGVDYEFYRKIDYNYTLEKEFLKVLNNKKINICYYGALASWFDYELIKKINKTNKYNIILFGVKYDNSFDKSKIGYLKNVYYFGKKDYSVLKNYAIKCDVFTIPFVINDITNATSPVKLFEYMAMEKPIITTAMPECKKYKSVVIGENHEDFINKLDDLVLKKNDKKYLNLLNKEAIENDWSKKAETIIKGLEQFEGKKGNND